MGYAYRANQALKIDNVLAFGAGDYVPATTANTYGWIVKGYVTLVNVDDPPAFSFVPYVPPGGASGQVLRKNSGGDFDVSWGAGGAGADLNAVAAALTDTSSVVSQSASSVFVRLDSVEEVPGLLTEDDLDAAAAALVADPMSALAQAIAALAPAVPAPSTAPTVTVGSVTATGATVTIGAVSNATTYELDVRIGSGSWVPVSSPTAGSNTVTGLTANTSTYSARARGINTTGQGPYGTATFATPPLAPTGTPTLALGAVTETSLVTTLAAGTSAGQDSFTIDYRPQGQTTWQSATGRAVGSFTLTGLAGGVAYEVRAYGVNAGGSGTPTATQTKSTVVPVGGVSFTAVGGNLKVDLTGSAQNAASLQAQRAATAGGTYSNVGPASNGATLTYTDTTVVNGTQYFYRLAITDTGGNVTYSSVAAATPIVAAGQIGTLTSRNTLRAFGSPYPIARYREPGRTKVVVRNLAVPYDAAVPDSGKAIQVVYSTQTNAQGTQPTDASAWFSVPVGSEFVDTSGNTNKMYVRVDPSNVNAGSQLVEVYTEVTVQ